MKYATIFVTVIGLSWLMACQTENKKTQEPVQEQTFFETKEKDVFVSWHDCKQSDSICTYFKVNYLEIISPDSKAAKNINREVYTNLLNLLKGYGSGKGTETSLEKIGLEFIDDYDAFIKEFPESAQTWMVETTVSKSFESKDIVTFRIDVDSYTGGAHGNYVTRYLNYRTEDGAAVTLSDVFADTVQLKKALLTALRKQKSLNEDTDLGEAGFFLENNEIPLSENFGFTKTGFVFHFDPYIIAPFSMGSIEIDLPRGMVKLKKLSPKEQQPI